jgi:cytochrome c biogenesis protein CcdA
LPVFAALGIGMLAAIAPCSLTTNLAAVAYVSSRLSDSRKTVLAGLAYSAGRALTYTVLGLLIFWLGAEIIEATEVFRVAAGVVLGLLFILAGAIILEKIKLNFAIGGKLQAALTEKMYSMGVLGAFGLGAVFALAFCPYMAALFFGALVPLALATPGIGAALPAVFGIGSALPVVAFALLAAAGVTAVGSYVDRIRQVEPLIRKLFGAALIVFGAYMVLATIM